MEKDVKGQPYIQKQVQFYNHSTWFILNYCNDFAEFVYRDNSSHHESNNQDR